MQRLCGFLIFGGIVLNAHSAEHLSYKSMSEELQSPDLITELYKTKKVSPPQKKSLEKLLQANEKNWLKWRQAFEQSSRFVRGEIDGEKTLNALILWFQWSELHGRTKAKEHLPNLSAWMQMSADLAYEEASLIGLRAASVIRNLSFDSIEEKLLADHGFAVLANPLLRRARAPWPIDRVLMAEGKKVLEPTALLVLEKATFDLQKNPYQTLEKALKKRPGSELSVLEPFKAMWTEKDIERMTDEVNRLGRLQILSAATLFEKQKKRAPSTVDELLSAGFLDRGPLDYKTGKKMELSSQL